MVDCGINEKIWDDAQGQCQEGRARERGVIYVCYVSFLINTNKNTILCFVFAVYSKKGTEGDIGTQKERKKRNP